MNNFRRLIEQSQVARPSIPSATQSVNQMTRKPSNDYATQESTNATDEYNKLLESMNEYEVSNLTFALMSNEDREALATTTISSSEKSRSSQCINSADLGSTSKIEICPRCKLRYPNCPGHYGLIKFPTPIFQPMFKKMMIDVMSVVCHSCGLIKIGPESVKSYGIMNLPPKARLRAILDINKDKDSISCWNCCAISPSVKKSDPSPNKIIRDAAEPLSIETVESFLNKERFTPEMAAVLGFVDGSHPGNIIMRNLLVLPEQLRRGFFVDGNTKHSDLTNAYSSIVAECVGYDEDRKKGSSTEVMRNRIERLSKAVHELFTHPESTNGDKDVKGIMEAFKGKEAISRPGRRTNNNARSVLGPNPDINFGEITIPEGYAKTLLYQEIVFQHNIEKLKLFIAKGQVKYIIKKGETNKQKIKDEERMTYSRNLEYGDTCFRHTMNGDLVILNRQPTIDKGSLQAYKVRIWNQATIGIFLPSTSAHNIDFDGDEGNIYSSIGIESIAELDEILHSTNSIISTQSGKPAVGLVMNALSGGYALTSPGVLVDKAMIMNAFSNVLPNFTFRSFWHRALQRGALMYYKNPGTKSVPVTNELIETSNNHTITIRDGSELDAKVGTVISYNGVNYKVVIPGIISVIDGVLHHRSDGLIRVTMNNMDGIPDLFDGKLYFSVALPESFQYRRGNVLIQDGIMVSGRLDKAHIGASTGSIIQVISVDFGKDVATKFISDSSHILDEYARTTGISVGLFDYCPTLGSEKRKEELLESRSKIMSELRDKISDLPDPEECNIELKKRIENKTVEYMDIATNSIGTEILDKYIDPNSGLTIMAKSGAKGSISNLASTIGMIGPQYERGYRIKYVMSSESRTTPYFVPNEKTVESRGFVYSNYEEGVTPADAAHMSIPTRTSVVDTAVGIASIGYLTRSMARFFEDIITPYTGGVIINAEAPGSKSTSVKRVVRTMYGDDGFDTSKLEMVKTPIGNVFLPVNIERLVSNINSKYDIFETEKIVSEYTGPIEYE